VSLKTSCRRPSRNTNTRSPSRFNDEPQGILDYWGYRRLRCLAQYAIKYSPASVGPASCPSGAMNGFSGPPSALYSATTTLLAMAGPTLSRERVHVRDELLDAIAAPHSPAPKNEPNPDEFLTVEQVAQALKVIPDTVRTWIQAGALRASRPGDATGASSNA